MVNWTLRHYDYSRESCYQRASLIRVLVNVLIYAFQVRLALLNKGIVLKSYSSLRHCNYVAQYRTAREF